ncbi:Lipopolysaccharide-induced tumor necrosis factor-alpha factor [Amphibalanus amphitrite]|uniref:Lipopolysaccharide-induced tumor necrosis factor-alpha factor n=1 Tax=Amphibalanus amphitrite TaxID=1232801 RepID=A0A6A4V0N3_AMPAM|nr:Lipopolysaccharide-induced tumor necrosis factor-alpha factor [Amphibalanus amphitrite]
MSKPSAPSHDYQQPSQGPPSYNQAISEGASPHLPPGGVPMAVPTATVIQTVPYTGPNPTHMMCPHCHAEIDTSVRSSPSTTAWVSGLLIALFGCWMGCCLIPCCMDECMDKEHYCPNCKAFLGRYRR